MAADITTRIVDDNPVYAVILGVEDELAPRPHSPPPLSSSTVESGGVDPLLWTHRAVSTREGNYDGENA